MFLLERTYDFKELVRHNVHTHSVFSKCAKPEMIPEDMVREAERIGLKTIAVTDHSDPGDDIDTFAVYQELKRRMNAMQTSVRVLIGAELSAYGIGKYAEPEEVDQALDFASYSHIHYHLDTWDQPEDRSPRGYAMHNLAVLTALFETGRADHIAHPFSPAKMHFFNEEEKAATLRAISDAQLGDILEMGEKAQCSWEIHTPSFLRFPDFARRFFHIGKEIGVHFCIGTDAHTLAALDPGGLLQQLEGIVK